MHLNKVLKKRGQCPRQKQKKKKFIYFNLHKHKLYRYLLLDTQKKNVQTKIHHIVYAAE